MSRDDNINPFIEIQVYTADDKEDKARSITTCTGGEDLSARTGYSGIGKPHVRRTKVVLDNGYSPQFNEHFQFSLETKYPELAFVRWVVMTSPTGKSTSNNCTTLAVFTAKLGSLQQGYRHLPLYNTYGEEFIFSTLFCKIKTEEPVLSPSSLEEFGARTTSRNILRSVWTRAHSNERGGDRIPPEEQKKKVMQELRERTRRT